MRLSISILFTLLFVACQNRSKADYELTLLPQPQEVNLKQGTVRLSKGVYIEGDCINHEFFWNKMKAKGIDKGNSISVTFVEDATILNNEAYVIEIDDGIVIKSRDKAGELYGIVTLSQLIKNSVVPKVLIKDEPAFKWRSFMLDEARYFFGKEVVKGLMDEMVNLKMNVFHWHLTNDPGWRIEIKKYPLLTQIGSRRDSSQVNDHGKKWESKTSDGMPHGGFYTQDEISEIVAYANNLNIEIVPEITMPGHTSAAIASYPWLGSATKPIKVPSVFAGHKVAYNVANPKTIVFIQDVLQEVSELFPSNIIHVGGDEVKYDQWKENKEIACYMKKHQLDNYSDVQVHFTNNISNYIENSLGKRMMAWNEVMGHDVHECSTDEDNAKIKLSEKTIIHFWEGDIDNLKMAVNAGHQIVNSQKEYSYLDYTYEVINLEKAYSFNPIPSELSKNEAQQIMGLGAQMWSEWTPTTKELYIQIFPRIAALAEVGWTSVENKDYKRFLNNVKLLYKDWQKNGITPTSMDIATAMDIATGEEL